MKLNELPIEKVEAMVGRYVARLNQCWAEIQRRKQLAESPDFSMFSDTTRRLLVELWDAPDKTISHQDVREDVIGDADASLSAIWNVVYRAKKELLGSGMSIENAHGKGYKLVLR